MVRFAAVMMLALAVGLSSARAQSVSGLLDRYERGDYEAATRDAIGTGGARAFSTLFRDLERNAPIWLARRAADGRDHRLAVAAFVLEVAAGFIAAAPVAENQLAAFDRLHEVQAAIRPALEWACELMRSSERVTGERAWWLASIELIKGSFGDSDLLYGKSSAATPSKAAVEIPSHLKHAIERFPDESYFRLVAAVGPVRRWPSDVIYSIVAFRRATFDRSQAPTMIAQATADRVAQTAAGRTGLGGGPGRSRAAADEVEALLRAESGLRPLEGVPPIQSEVRLYLGSIAACFGENDVARKYFDGVDPGTTPAAIPYIALYLRGRLDESDGRTEDAIRFYRRALTVVPRAHAATAALSALDWIGGNPTDAAAIVRASDGEPVRDPWFEWYAHAGVSRWPSRLTELRAQLRAQSLR
jgi:hypothetical protein